MDVAQSNLHPVSLKILHDGGAKDITFADLHSLADVAAVNAVAVCVIYRSVYIIILEGDEMKLKLYSK